ncbi:DUF397 domain-containing protein [Lentzea kentuckyensis]
MLVRDSQNADAGTLMFSAPAWRAFGQRQP